MAQSRSLELSQGTWRALTRALETYRNSLDLYRQVIETRADLARAGRFKGNGQVPLRNGHAPDVHAADLATLKSLNELTPREREVARLMALGFTNQQIASQLVVTRGTTANHVAHILAKLGLTNRTQVAAHVVAAGSDGQTDTYTHNDH